MAPVQDALSVPEILEGILLNLPLRQIIKLRSLCHEFRRIIDETTTIQRALFLQPSSPERLLWHVPERARHYHNAGHTGIRYVKDKKGAAWRSLGDAENPTRYPILNPFFPLSIRKEVYEKQWHAWRMWGLFLKTTELVTYQHSKKGTAYLRLMFPSDIRYYDHEVKGLFKNMYFTHPPTKRLSYDVRDHHTGVVGFNQDHITIGGLLRHHVKRLEGRKSKEDPLVHFHGGHRVALLAGTVDEMTGYEMFAILDSQMGELSDELFVRDKTGEIWFRYN